MENKTVPNENNIKLFNDYLAEIRSRMDSLTKQVLLISGGIQTITISAFLSEHNPKLSENTISLLKHAWIHLSFSIIFCLIYMFLQIVSQLHVATKHTSYMRNPSSLPQFFDTSPVLGMIIMCVGLGAFFLCLSGIYTISNAAVSLIGASNGV